MSIEDILISNKKVVESIDSPEVIQPESFDYDTKKGTLLIRLNEKDLDLAELEEKYNIDGFDKKEEFHVTVFGFKKGRIIKKVLDKLPEAEREEVRSQLNTVISSTDWSVVVQPEYHHLEKKYEKDGNGDIEVRESHIQMISMPGVQKLYEEVNRILNLDLDFQPTHVTLYTKGNKMGIGVDSYDQLQSLIIKDGNE